MTLARYSALPCSTPILILAQLLPRRLPHLVNERGEHQDLEFLHRALCSYAGLWVRALRLLRGRERARDPGDEDGAFGALQPRIERVGTPGGGAHFRGL